MYQSSSKRLLQDKEFGGGSSGDDENAELNCDAASSVKTYWDEVAATCVTCEDKFYADKATDTCVQDECDPSTQIL